MTGSTTVVTHDIGAGDGADADDGAADNTNNGGRADNADDGVADDIDAIVDVDLVE